MMRRLRAYQPGSTHCEILLREDRAHNCDPRWTPLLEHFLCHGVAFRTDREGLTYTEPSSYKLYEAIGAYLNRVHKLEVTIDDASVNERTA